METKENPSAQQDIHAFIAGIPKAELHVHLEGCLHPALIHRLAERNGITVHMEDTLGPNLDLETFLQIYLNGLQVLVTEDDFYDVVRDYLDKAAKQNVVHVEMFFDPQLHLERGVALQTIIAGVRRAAEEKLDVSFSLIMCFLRERSVDEAMRVLRDAAPYQDIIKGVGMDGDSTKRPPREFRDVYARAREMGLRTTAHCDVMASIPESIEQIRQAVEDLNVDRLDHASCILEDEALAALVAEKRIGITCCPRTGMLLYDDTEASLIRRMLGRGIKCSVHSDDPGYFDAYVNENLAMMADEGVSRGEILRLVRNSVEVSWASGERKRVLLGAIDGYVRESGMAMA